MIEADKDYQLYKMMYEDFGATDEVMEYAQKVLYKARAIEYSLTGQVYDRILRINRQLLKKRWLSWGQMHRIMNCGEFKPALCEFCGLKRLQNESYVLEGENTIIRDVMAYGR